MAQLTRSASATEPEQSSSSATLSRVAGGLGITHVVMMLGAFALEGVAAEHGIAPTKLLHEYGDAPLGRTLLAGYAESVSFFLLTASVIVIGWLFSRRTVGGRLAAQTFVALGVANVASTLAVGFPPGAAAVYAAHHGVDPVSLAMVNDIRNYAFVLQVAITCAMALALGVAALLERRNTRWIGWGGVVFGAVGLLATPFVHNAMSMGFLIWWVGVGVVLLRGKSPLE
jgi:hypothetical protein